MSHEASVSVPCCFPGVADIPVWGDVGLDLGSRDGSFLRADSSLFGTLWSFMALIPSGEEKEEENSEQ
jgi:hypothetical protein